MAIYNYGDVTAWILLTSTYGGNTYNVYLKTEVPPDIGDVDKGAIGIDFPNRGHFGFTLNTEDITIKISKVYAVTKAKWDELKTGIINLQDTTTEIRLRIQVGDDPSDIYEAFDGSTGIYMPVIIKHVKGKKKIYRGNTTLYQIGQIGLKQIGVLAAS